MGKNEFAVFASALFSDFVREIVTFITLLLQFRANDLMMCIQTGIRHSVSKLASKAERDLLMKDFMEVERVFHKK